MSPVTLHDIREYSIEQLVGKLDEWATERRADYGIRFEIAKECWWSCELRWTAEPNTPGPDQSVVHYSAGTDTAHDALVRAMLALADWLKT